MITSVCMFWFIYLFLNPAFNQSIVCFSVSKVLGYDLCWHFYNLVHVWFHWGKKVAGVRPNVLFQARQFFFYLFYYGRDIIVKSNSSIKICS